MSTRYELGKVCHYGRYFYSHPEFGLVYPLSRDDYYRELLDWLYEDDDESEGIMFVSHRVTGSIRYVVVSEITMYRASNRETGEILECSTMKALYRFAMRNAKDTVRDGEPVCFLHIEKVVYSDYEFLNSAGYMQREIVKRDDIAMVVVTRGGYTIENANGSYDIERG